MEVQAVPPNDNETESEAAPEQVAKTRPDEKPEAESGMPAPQADSGDEAGESQHQAAEPVAEQEHLSGLTEPVSEHFILFSFCHGAAPKVLHAFSRKDTGQLIRDLARNEDQFLFVVRGGELAQLFKTKRGLIVQFDGTRERIKVQFAARSRPVDNGWIGDLE